MNISSQGPEGMILGGRYRIVRLIGSGGMANVYLATDMSSGLFVAIKILKPEFTADEDFIKRFDTEAKAAASLSHPNIVRVLGVGQEGEFRYMVQEYVEGITAKDLITQNGHLDWRVAVPIAIQVGMALENAHQNGIVHRDIKPHNILITRERIAKVTDFGIARAASSNTITLTSGGALGSVHYFSPEQARGAMVGASSDIYSLGVLLFEMVTGRVPFDGDTSVAIAIKHLQEPPPLASAFVPGIPAGLDAIIQKCMQKSVDYRYATIREMFTELDELMVDPSGAYGILTKSDLSDVPTGQMQAMRHDPNYGKLRDIEHSIEQRRRSRTKDNVLVILLIAIIMGVLVGSIVLINNLLTGKLTGNDNNTFTVKYYVGKNIVDVMEEFEDLSFVDYDIEYEKSTEYVAGVIIKQNLNPGLEITKGSGLFKLILTVSIEEESITLGNYEGFDAQEVENELITKGLTVTTRPETSSTILEGLVIRTEPGSGSVLMPGDLVVLIVSQNSPTVEVPELQGLTLEKAEEILSENKLFLGAVEIVNPDQSLPPESQYVLTSDPAKGTPVSINSSIKLYVGTLEDLTNFIYGITPTPTPVSSVVSISASPVAGGSVTGYGTYLQGTNVTVTANPSSGYQFVSWVNDSFAVVSTSESYSFTMPPSAVNLTAIFAINTPTPTSAPTSTPTASPTPEVTP
jgi:uncharacterized repeat protein (TIGR02543 family)